MKDFIKKNLWKILTVVFISGGFVVTTQLSIAENKEDIISLTTLMKEQQKISIDNQTIMRSIQIQIELIVQLYLTITGDTVKNWKEIPRKPPMDSFGNPILNVMWLELTDDSMYAAFCMFDDTGKVVTRELWDKRKKR